MRFRLALPSRLVWLGAAGGVAWTLNIIGLAYTARVLGSVTFGLLAFGLSIAAYAAVLAAPGLNVWGIRAVSRDVGAAGRYLAIVNGTQLVLGIVAYAITALGAAILLPANEAGLVIATAIGVFSLGVGVQWLCQSLERYDLIGISQLITGVATLALIVALVRGPADVVRVPVAMLAGQAIAGAATLVLLARTGRLRSIRIRFGESLQALRTSLALGVAPILITILHHANTLILQLTRGAADVGLFTSGYRLIEMLGIAPTLVTSLFFPRLARSPAGGPAWVEDMRGFVTLTMALAFFPALVMAIEGGEIARTLYGSDYQQAGPVIRIMSFGVLFNFAAIAYLMGVLAAHRDRAYLVSLGLTAVVSVGGGIALVPAFGLFAATVIVSALDLVTWLLTLPVHRRVAGTIYLGAWVRPGGAALVTGLWLVLSPQVGVPFLARLVGAGLLYAGLVFLRSDTRHLTGAVA